MADNTREIQHFQTNSIVLANNNEKKLAENKNDFHAVVDEIKEQSTYNFDDVLMAVSPDSADALEEGFKEFVILLCGIGLNVEEIRLLKQRGIDMSSLFTLTESDLEFVGIQNSQRRQKIVESLKNLNPRKVAEENEKYSKSCATLSVEEGKQILSLTASHLEELDLVLDTLCSAVAKKFDDIYVDERYSSRAVLLVVMQLAAEQANSLHYQLHEVPNNLAELQNVQYHGAKSAKWGFWKLFGLSIPISALVVLTAWKSRNYLSSYCA